MRQIDNPIEDLRLKYLRKYHLAGDEEKLARNQCVITSLESLTSERAPDQIRIKRVRDMRTKALLEFAQGLRNVVKKDDKLLISIPDISLDEQMKTEERAVKNLIRDARRSMSPFGRALRQRPFHAGSLTKEEVIEQIHQGNDVFVMGFVVPFVRVAHIAHVGLIGRFMYDVAALYPIIFQKGTPIRSLIFPKSKR